VDLRRLASEKREQEARKMAEQEAQVPCNLAQGPLLRVTLLRLDGAEHVLLLTLHHMITDGWSDTVLLRELSLLYQAYASGQPSPLPPLAIQYADFAIWQRNWLKDAVLQKHLDYWKKQLEGASELQLPTDRPRPAIQSYRGSSYSFALPADLSRELATFSRQEEVTLFMLLLAAFQTLLYRLSGQADVVVGTDIANRTHVETENLIGFFVNLLALRADLRGSPLFSNLLRRVREMVLGAYVHQHIPFEMLVEHLRLERSMNRTPLVQVLFVLQNIPGTSHPLADIRVLPMQSKITTVKFDLALFLQEGADGIRGFATYNTDVFDEHTIAMLLHRFEVLLRALVHKPDISIDVVDIDTDEEKAAQIYVEESLSAANRKDLRISRGEEVDLSALKTWQMKQKKR